LGDLSTISPELEVNLLMARYVQVLYVHEYNLREKATPSGSVYIMAFKGMYGLPQAKLIANELLESRLNKHGCPFTLNALNLRVLPPLKAQKSHLLGTDKE
jgi:hypothetical protein